MSFFFTINNNLLKYILYFLPIIIIIGNAAINLVLGVIVLLYFVRSFIEKKIIFFEKPVFRYFLIFYIYLILNSFFSTDLKLSLMRTIPFFKFFIFVLIYTDFIEEKKIQIKRLGIFWILILFILGLDIIFQSIVGHNITGYKSEFANRNSSFFYNELIAGGFIFSLIFITLKMAFKDQNNFLEKLIIIFFFIVVFLTGERSNFIKFSLIFLIGFFLWFKYQNYTKKIIVVSLLFLSILSIYNTKIFNERYLTTISNSPNTDLGIVNNFFRSTYGSHALSAFYIFKDNIFFGVGNKNFRVSCIDQKKKVLNYQKIIDPNGKNFSDGCSTHPHQIYYEFFSEHGLLGTLFILFILFKLIKIKTDKEKLSSINLFALLYILTTFLPILPSGSFFTTTFAMLFWLNYIFFQISKNKIN